MGISQAKWHKKRKTGGKRPTYKKKRNTTTGAVPNWSYPRRHLFASRSSRSRRWLHPRGQRARVLHQEAQGQEGQIDWIFIIVLIFLVPAFKNHSRLFDHERVPLGSHHEKENIVSTLEVPFKY